MTETLLEVRDLTIRVDSRHGSFQPVREVSFDLHAGRRAALVGESGSGKSLTVLALMGLLGPNVTVAGGTARFGVERRDLLSLSPQEWRQVRGSQIAMVYQDPLLSLNPVKTIGWQIAEGIRLHSDTGRRAARARATELLHEVGMPHPKRHVDQYPHEFSGGMRQRAVIAMALSTDPKLLLADEPTTALDVTTQARILELLVGLAERHDLAVLLISHDLGVAAQACDEVNVMYAGRLVESGPLKRVFASPRHPYTAGLLTSIVTLDTDPDQRVAALGGHPPSPESLPPGCAFSERCPHSMPVCLTVRPELVQMGDHRAACHLNDPSMVPNAVELQ